jgi:hypothetical protein
VGIREVITVVISVLRAGAAKEAVAAWQASGTIRKLIATVKNNFMYFSHLFMYDMFVVSVSASLSVRTMDQWPLLPLGHCPRGNPRAFRQYNYALLTMLERSTHRLCRAGASV